MIFIFIPFFLTQERSRKQKFFPYKFEERKKAKEQCDSRGGPENLYCGTKRKKVYRVHDKEKERERQYESWTFLVTSR
jgi:hypothetical protein